MKTYTESTDDAWLTKQLEAKAGSLKADRRCPKTPMEGHPQFIKETSMSELPPPLQLLALINGHVLPRCIHVIAEAGVADALDDTPMTAESLGRATDLDGRTLHRLLRLISTAGIFEMRDGKWAHTAVSRFLRSDHPQSMRAFARMIGDRVNWSSLGELEYAVRTGNAAIGKVAPEGIWGYYQAHPERGRIFDEAMTAKAHADNAAILDAYDFSKYRVIADIAGGRGHLLKAVLAKYPAANGILFDLPGVVGSVESSARMSLVAGDFFKNELPAADAYLVGHILHDWADKEATAILRAIRRAAPAQAQLLVLEFILPEEPGPHLAKVLDILMLSATGGLERTKSEYASLLADSGFKFERVVPTASPISVIVAAPGN